MTYKASLDTVAKIVTCSIVLLFVGTFFAFLFTAGIENKIISPIVGISFTLILVLTYFFAPTKYTITKDVLIIHRPVYNIEIPKIEIKTALLNTSKAISIRTFGVGGLFGYFGSFHSFDLGSTTWYATKHKNQILIERTNGQKIILSPDDINGFLDEFNKS
jgi:Bacterial PH domain